jgi:hypothetical protein
MLWQTSQKRRIYKMTKKIGMVLIIVFVMSTDVFAQFYKQNPVVEFDVDFSGTLGVLHYSDFRPSEDDAWLEINLYFQWVVDKIDQILILTSFRHIKNNTALDDRIKTFMRRNRLTLCITNYPKVV